MPDNGGKLNAKAIGEIAEKMEQAIMRGHNFVPFLILLVIAVAKDACDALVICQTPGVNQILDVVVTGILLVVLHDIGGHIRIKVRVMIFIVSAFEFIPLVGALPGYTISVFYAWHKVRKMAESGEEGLEQIKRGKLDGELHEQFAYDD